MKLRHTFLAAALALTVPFASHAQSGSTAAVNACVKSFTEAYLPKYSVKRVRKDRSPVSPLEAFYKPSTYTIALAAYGVHSGELLAQARCVASGKGVVVVLDTPPAGEYVARADYSISLR